MYKISSNTVENGRNTLQIDKVLPEHEVLNRAKMDQCSNREKEYLYKSTK